MTKDEVIDKLWERSNHGTRREDVVAAYEAGAAAEREECAKVCDELAEINRRASTDSMWQQGECAAAIRARKPA